MDPSLFMGDVGEILPFPSPVVGRGKMDRLRVAYNDGRAPVEKVVLQTSNNRFYELGRLLREAIYGQVNFAILLDCDSNGNLSRTNPPFQVAIKVYGKAKLRQMQGKTQENPIAEIGMMQHIGSHPNLMSPLECCQDHEYIYLVMEFCDGGELYDLIEEQQHLDEPTARHYFVQILNGLSHLQSLCIAHRDMSLENVLISRSSASHSAGVESMFHGGEAASGSTSCKIIDFGMSLRLPRNESTGRAKRVLPCGVCGKKNYIAPEVIESNSRSSSVSGNGAVSGAVSDAIAIDLLLADVWAVGVMLFIMLTGCPPVELAAPIDKRFVMIARGGLALMLEQWGIRLSPQAVDLLHRVLRPNPDHRLPLADILRHPWVTGT